MEENKAIMEDKECIVSENQRKIQKNEIVHRAKLPFLSPPNLRITELPYTIHFPLLSSHS